MSESSEQRKKVVILAASVALLSAFAPTIMRVNRTLGFVWLFLMILALVFTIVQFGKAMRDRNR